MKQFHKEGCRADNPILERGNGDSGQDAILPYPW